MDEEKTTAELGPVVVGLLRGVLYRDQHETLWQDLLSLQAQVMDYLKVVGLLLEVDEAEGYAFLRQMEEGAGAAPRLIQRRPMSYPVSLLCVLLRKKLVEADAGGGEVRVILTRDQIVDMVRVFLPDPANEAKLVDKIDTHINKIVELGFLRRLSQEGRVFEVRRIIKALVDADMLADMDKLLSDYRAHAASD